MEEYKNIEKGELQSVDLDLNSTNVLDLQNVDQFFKTCGSNQQFLLTNENIKVFKMVLTGGSLGTPLFLHPTKVINIITEAGDLDNYNALLKNRIYCFIEKIGDQIDLTLGINEAQ